MEYARERLSRLSKDTVGVALRPLPKNNPKRYRGSACEAGLASEDTRYGEHHHYRYMGPLRPNLRPISSCPDLSPMVPLKDAGASGRQWASRTRSPTQCSAMHSTAQSILRKPIKSSISRAPLPLRQQYAQTYDKVYGDIVKERELMYFRNVFQAFDTDGSGAISRPEFLMGMRNEDLRRVMSERFGCQPHQSDKIFRLLDDGKTGEISLDQWFACVELLMAQPTDTTVDIESLLRMSLDMYKRGGAPACRKTGLPAFSTVKIKDAQFTSGSAIDSETARNSHKWFVNMHPLHVPPPYTVALA